MAEVLLVGAESVFPAEMEACIREKGHAPLRLQNAVQVISSAEPGGVRLTFLDADSARYDALDLLRKLVSRQPEGRVVMTASSPSTSFAVDAVKEGAWDYLLRPVEIEKLGLLMEQVFGASPAAPSAPASSSAAAGEEGLDPWEIITQDPGFQRVISIAERASSGVSSVLIQGESGTGKEMLARFIHAKSPRKEKPFVAVNCAALPESLLESEMFGHEKGAFTGAVSRRVGKFEQAQGGTLLLDEIAEMDVHLQAKLLRVLQEKTIDRLGGKEPVAVDVRVVATTNRRILSYIEEGKFREDLYYRLNVIPLNVPPLRDRPEDIPVLVEHFIKKYNAISNNNIHSISKEVYETLGRLAWRGNVRELENAIERAVVLADGPELLVEHLLLEEAPVQGPGAAPAPEAGADALAGHTVHEMERRLILSTMKKVSENRTRAADMLGISIRTLRNKLKEYESEASPGD